LLVKERTMKLLYKFETSVGVFYIGQSEDGRYHPIFDDESLGSYARPGQAAEDLAGGHTFSPRCDADTADLGIPEHHSEWTKIH
jgi:hypothetical protein